MRLLEAIFIINLVLLSLDHLITGLLCIFFPNYGLNIYRKMFGVNIAPTEGHFLLLKPWGALGVFAAISGVLVIMDSWRYSGILIAMLILLFLRLIIRFTSREISNNYLSLNGKRNLFHIGLILLSALILLIQIYFIFMNPSHP